MHRQVWVLVPVQVLIRDDTNCAIGFIETKLDELSLMAEMREYKTREEAIGVCEQAGYQDGCLDNCSLLKA